MSEPKLKAKLFVHAALRRCSMQALSAVVASKGDEDAGTVMVRVYRGNGLSQVYVQARDGAGRLTWMPAIGDQPVSDDKADSYVQRAKQVDSDLWVLDVDSPSGHVPFIHDDNIF